MLSDIRFGRHKEIGSRIKKSNHEQSYGQVNGVQRIHSDFIHK